MCDRSCGDWSSSGEGNDALFGNICRVERSMLLLTGSKAETMTETLQDSKECLNLQLVAHNMEQRQLFEKIVDK